MCVTPGDLGDFVVSSVKVTHLQWWYKQQASVLYDILQSIPHIHCHNSYLYYRNEAYNKMHTYSSFSCTKTSCWWSCSLLLFINQVLHICNDITS